MAIVNGKTVLNNMIIKTSTGTVFMQEEEPSTFKDGDVWFKLVNGKATNAYSAENGHWVEVAFDSSIIAENIVGKIITGGEINGTTINGSEFTNAFNNVVAGVNVVSDGKTSISNGALSEIASYYLVNTEGERLYLFADNEAYLTRGSLEVRQKLYNEEGTKTSESSAQLSGGLLQLNLTDSTGTYNGVLDAKLLESMSGIKQRIVTIPNTTNYANGRIEYRRFGQIVTVAIKFDRLTANGWITLSNIPNGYRPYSYIDASAYLASTGNRGSFVSLYTDPSFNFIYIPSVPGGSTTTETYQGSLTYFTNQAWSLA